VFIQGTSLLLEDVGGEDPELTLSTLRTLLRMIEEKTRLVQLLDDYISSGGLTIVIGTEHHAGPAVLQPGRGDVLRRARDRRRGRHRADADALLPCDQRGRKHVESHHEDGQFKIMNQDNNTHNIDDPAVETEQTAPAAVADVAEIQRQRDEYYDLLLRKSAEFDNYRKRIDRERQAVSEAAAANLIEEILPLVDDLDRALSAEPGSDASDAYRRGVELIHRQLEEILRKRGVRAIEALGADFDPHYHQAVSHEPAEGRREGEIIEEFRRGYMLGDRLLRPSMVKVAKG
jgi:molecular chaperone GrpE